MKKILMIPGGLHMGGAERVAANISSYAPEGEFEFHYLVFEGHDDVYGPEIEARGGKVITLPPPAAGYASYVGSLKKLLRENRYSAVHSHTMFNSGINLAVAKLMGVPVRIAHSHTTKTERKVSRRQRIYERIMQRVILWSATDLLACGVEAGEWLFGKKAFSKRGVVIRNGIDTDAFAYSEGNRSKVRSKYGIASDDYVIGHSGTLIPLKNQEFLIRLLPKLREAVPNARLMLLGRGEQSELDRLKGIAADSGAADSVIFCGGVMNSNECLSAMDVFAFPSLREGTPLALIEAQANGLPCVISDRIPCDAILTDLVKPLPLEDGKVWIDELIKARRDLPGSYSRKIEEAGYSIKTSYAPIYVIYCADHR
ncbi:MAG: glycosyltransferase [Clostridiales bacterium]|nr:glycosyltransferase [Clostridiales bacterium]